MADKSEAERLRAKALARWEGEGGALGRPDVALAEEDIRVLARLGAAVLLEWASLPEARRSAIVGRAAQLHAERDAPRVKQAIESFISDHHDL